MSHACETTKPPVRQITETGTPVAVIARFYLYLTNQNLYISAKLKLCSRSSARLCVEKSTNGTLPGESKLTSPKSMNQNL